VRQFFSWFVKFNKVFFVLFREVNQIGDEPSGVAAVAVEPGHFEIPVLDLENVELHRIHVLENEISFFDFVKE
jgi:hypothetical protein